MLDTLVTPVLRTLSSATGVDVHQLDEQRLARMPALNMTSTLKIGRVMSIACDQGWLMVTRYGQPPLAVIVAGPFGHLEDSFRDVPVLDKRAEERLAQALNDATVALSRLAEEQRRRVELASQLELINSAAIAIATDLELEPMLRRIVDLAQHMTGARYAALALPDTFGQIETFVSVGIDPELAQLIGYPPNGLGILGVLLHDARPIRTMDLATHPASIGFPANHPPMTSFLGVPIVVRDSVLGSIYLAEKRLESAFTEEDTRLVQVLARYAGVAIENAGLFRNVSSLERRLQAICEQMPAALIVTESDPDRVMLANRTASDLFGWDIQTPLSLESLLTHNEWRFPDGTHMPREATPWWRALRQGERVRQFTCDLTRPDGHTITVMVNAAPLTGEDHQVTGAVAAFQDLTDLQDGRRRDTSCRARVARSPGDSAWPVPH